MHPAARPTDANLLRGTLTVGDFELNVCSDGTYLLDGGAMFGVVPKTLWQKRAVPDSENRILLGLNTVVVRTGSATVVIETGIGNRQPEKMQQIHQNQARLPASLQAAGVDQPKSRMSSTPTCTSTTAAGIRRPVSTARFGRPSPTPATLPSAARSSTATCNSIATKLAIFRRTTIH